MSYQGKTDWKHNDTVTEKDMNRIEQGVLDANADNSATDDKIGTRTINDSAAPTANTSKLTGLLGWLGHMIKAITGEASWRTLPGMTIKGIKAMLDAATAAATPNTMIKRDASGRAKVATPVASDDIARKAEIDAALNDAIDFAKSFGLGAGLRSFVSDLNDLPTSGGTGFYATGGEGALNIPPGSGGNGSVIHIARDSRPSQLYMDYVSRKVYHRGYTATGWNDWVELINSSGGTMTGSLSMAPENGSANNRSNVVYFQYREASGQLKTTFIQVRADGVPIFRDSGGKQHDFWHGGNCHASISTIGYQKLASGLIIQWGRADIPSGVITSVPFPATFPTECAVVAPTIDTPAAFPVGTSGLTKSYFNVVHSSNATRLVTWIAVGY
ncbi:pyocin knob domain-containing protein [Paenibacillus sp. GCM10027626]|uniref:pyocin knob domain-containing protein n=1 Tax=Paenibacillus sp. GCM10027626 TaxID=3273411 RepID=UPI003626F038